jgi:hypothetical protein
MENRELMRAAPDLKAAVQDMDRIMEKQTYNRKLTAAWKQTRDAVGDFMPRALSLAMKKGSWQS